LVYLYSATLAHFLSQVNTRHILTPYLFSPCKRSCHCLYLLF